MAATAHDPSKPLPGSCRSSYLVTDPDYTTTAQYCGSGALDAADEEHLSPVRQAELVSQTPEHHEGDGVGRILGPVQQAGGAFVGLFATGAAETAITPLLRNTQQLLAYITAIKQPPQGSGRILQSMPDVHLIFAALGQPARQCLCGLDQNLTNPRAGDLSHIDLMLSL